MKRLSVIIVTYNSERHIFSCLDSIYNYTDIPREELEVIIVDNNSKDTEQMFAKITNDYGDNVILIRNNQNGGYGQGNNIGIRRATAPVVMIMNPDVRMVEPVFMSVLRDFEADPALCLYGIKQMLSNNVYSMSSFACTRMMNGYAYTLLDGICNRLNLFFPQFMYFQGSCFFLRKDQFEQVGLFDEDLFMYGEEDDITYRIRKAFGNCMRFNPHLHYLHLALKRSPNLEYEKRMLDSNIASNIKTGYSKEKTIKNKLRNIRMRLWREKMKACLGKKNEPLYDMLTQFKSYLIHS